MKNLENHKRPYTFGLGLSFIPLGFVTGMVNDKPVIGLFVGLLVALIIELIRYSKLKKV